MRRFRAGSRWRYSPYRGYDQERLILRDHLAIDRTVLANERTLLSYLRTAFAFTVAGLTFLQFFEGGALRVLGVTLLPVSALTAIIGVYRFLLVRARLVPLVGKYEGEREQVTAAAKSERRAEAKKEQRAAGAEKERGARRAGRK